MLVAVGTKGFYSEPKRIEGPKDVKPTIISEEKYPPPVFPLAFTGVCTQEMCDVSKLNDYSKLNAQVYGVSVDNPFARRRGPEKRF